MTPNPLLVDKPLRLDELPRKGKKVPELNVDALIDVLAVIYKRQYLEPEDIPKEP